MVDAVFPGDWLMFPGLCALDTAQIDAAFSWVAATLVVGVDTADLAEEVLRRLGTPTVTR